MGGSVVEARDNNNKMGESVASHGALEVSISFGRFENDSLSWEKWSSFSQNKYLEEVEKCSTPGSVAQKKAYFEAHYKKIAARKTELLEQENTMGTDSSRSNGTNCIDCIINTSGTDAECGIFNGQSSAEEVEHDNNSLSAVSSSLVDEPAGDDANALGCQSLIFESAKEEINGKSQSNEVIYPEKAALVAKEILNRLQEGRNTEEQPLNVDTEAIITQESTEEKSELDAVSQKVTQTKKELNLVRITKKKPVSPTTKSSEMSIPRTARLSKPTSTSTPRMSKPISTSTPRMSKPISTSTPKTSKPISTSTLRMSKPTSVSTHRLSKPISTPTMISVSRTSTKKPNVSSSPRSKNSSLAEIKRTAPTSLHMSLSPGLDSASLTTGRKSSIMEQMGDKDIVRRAFKTFQNNLNQLRPSTDEKSRGPKHGYDFNLFGQISARGSEHEVSTSMISQKENERTRKATEMNAQRTQLGTRWNTTSSRSLEETGVGKNVRVVSSSVCLRRQRSNERAEKCKELFEKQEEKSNATEEEKTGLNSKSKYLDMANLTLEDKDADIKRLRQGLNFKAKPVPGFYRGHGLSKSPSVKEGGKNKIGHKSESHG